VCCVFISIYIYKERERVAERQSVLQSMMLIEHSHIEEEDLIYRLELNKQQICAIKYGSRVKGSQK